MKFVFASILLILMWHQCKAIPTTYLEIENKRVKRANCDSTYGSWSEWSSCTMNCGYCGKQNRTRTCIPVDGCNQPICSGDSVENQDCGTNSIICLYPIPSCCKTEYKKVLDFVGRRFYCALRDMNAIPPVSTESIDKISIPSSTELSTQSSSASHTPSTIETFTQSSTSSATQSSTETFTQTSTSSSTPSSTEASTQSSTSSSTTSLIITTTETASSTPSSMSG